VAGGDPMSFAQSTTEYLYLANLAFFDNFLKLFKKNSLKILLITAQV